MKFKSYAKIYVVAVVFNYIVLVMDNFFFNLFEGKIPENLVWVFTTEYDNILDPITMVVMSFLLFVPFFYKIKDKYLYVFGFIYPMLILAFNKILFFGLESLLKEGLGFPDLFVFILGSIIFVNLFKKIKSLL